MKDDLRLDFDSITQWTTKWGITIKDEYDDLQINGLKLSVIDLPSLIQSYEFGLRQQGAPQEKYRHNLNMLKSVEKQKLKQSKETILPHGHQSRWL